MAAAVARRALPAAVLAAVFALTLAATAVARVRLESLARAEALFEEVAAPADAAPRRDNNVSTLDADDGALEAGAEAARSYERLRNFYDDPFDTYACRRYLHRRPGALPDFVVLGVHKGGSTALYGYLVQHGHVRPSSCKETRFFTEEERWARGMSFYRRHFYNTAMSPWVLTGEGTPGYIRDPLAPVRIAEALPRAKFIVSLRSPVERFVSHYVGFSLRNLTTMTCGEFWAEARDEIRDCERDYRPESYRALPTEGDGTNAWDALRKFADPARLEAVYGQDVLALPRGVGPACPAGHAPCARRYCLSQLFENAIARSIYVDQLVRWLKFVSADRIYLVQAETLYQDTRATLAQVASFLGLRPFRDAELSKFASTNRGTSHHALPQAKACNRGEITAYFAHENALLDALLTAQFIEAHSRWRPW